MWIWCNRIVSINRFIKEYDDIQTYDNFEFVIAYRVDGLQDLYHLMKQYAKFNW